jgi:Ca2+-binding EF-hand superfamily protein
MKPPEKGLTTGGGLLSSRDAMKHLSALPCLAAALFITGCATTPPAPTPEESFKKTDLNGDGKVSRAEYDSHMIGEMFARFDTNKDSVITEKEFLDNGGTAEGFRKINTSGSGKITLEEAKASAGIRKTLDAPFKEADVNRDGHVSLAEFLAARKSALDYVR